MVWHSVWPVDGQATARTTTMITRISAEKVPRIGLTANYWLIEIEEPPFTTTSSKASLVSH